MSVRNVLPPRVMARVGFVVLLIVTFLVLWQAARASGASLAAREQTVAASLRCPTCQGLSVAESSAPIAVGMRRIIDAQLAGGRNPAQVRDYFVARYGSWILLSPTTRGLAGLVWALPAFGLLAGAVLAWRVALRPALLEGTASTARHTTARVSRADRLAAAEELLAAVEEDRHAGLADDLGYERAMATLAAAHALPEDPPVPSGPPRPAVLTRRVGAGVRRTGAMVLLVGIATAAGMTALLSASLGQRAPGSVPTGNFAGLANPALRTSSSPPSSPPPAGTVAGLQNRANSRPADLVAWLSAGQAADASGDLIAAYRDYAHALALQPANPTAGYLVASALWRGGSAGEALPIISRLVTAEPTNAHALLLLGLIQRTLGHQRAADAALTRFLRLQPQGPVANAVRALQGTP